MLNSGPTVWESIINAINQNFGLALLHWKEFGLGLMIVGFVWFAWTRIAKSPGERVYIGLLGGVLSFILMKKGKEAEDAEKKERS